MCLGLFIYIYTSYQYPYNIKIQCLGICALLSWNPQCIKIFKYKFIYARYFHPYTFASSLKIMICAREIFPRFPKYISTYPSDFTNGFFFLQKFLCVTLYISLEYFGTLFLYIRWFLLYICDIHCSEQLGDHSLLKKSNKWTQIPSFKEAKILRFIKENYPKPKICIMRLT